MPSIREEMATDIAAAIAIYGQTFEWQGDDYPCVRRDQPTPMELQDAGGFIEGVAYFLAVAKSSFPNYSAGEYPHTGDLVNEGAHQIKSVNGHKDPAAAQLTLAIGSVDA